MTSKRFIDIILIFIIVTMFLGALLNAFNFSNFSTSFSFILGALYLLAFVFVAGRFSYSSVKWAAKENKPRDFTGKAESNSMIFAIFSIVPVLFIVLSSSSLNGGGSLEGGGLGIFFIPPIIYCIETLVLFLLKFLNQKIFHSKANIYHLAVFSVLITIMLFGIFIYAAMIFEK